MAFKRKDSVTQEGGFRRFNAINNMVTADYWQFKYITKDINSQDQTETGAEVWPNPKDPGSPYKRPFGDVLGTIFFDASSTLIYMNTSIADVIIDTTPPVFVGEDIQYTTFQQDHVCKLTIKSDTLIDVCQLVIKNGDGDDNILYQCLRNSDNGEQRKSENISNISYIKSGNTYVLSFTIKKGIEDNLNTDQITVEVWDIAANKATYTTSGEWKNYKTPEILQHLIIEFVDVEPKDKIISKNVEGTVVVLVTNPNVELWEIQPTFHLTDTSIGVIDESSIREILDTEGNHQGVWTFNITHIDKKGMIDLEAWIDVANSDIRESIKNQTYAEGILGPFIFADEGRKYKFNTYTPTYLNDDLYKAFVQFTQDFLNTSQESLSTGNSISTLEKIARINNFNDPFRTEPPFLTEYAKQFNITLNPKLDEYMYYLDSIHRQADEVNNE